MAENSNISLIALQKSIQESLSKPEAKEQCLLFEYKLLLLYSANFGIYVLPQTNCTEIWHGVVFVRYGIFKDAKFKFKMLFDSFPRRPPKVYFMSEIWHPCIDNETGLLDVGEEIEKGWNYGTEHLIFTIIEYIRLIFLDVKFYENIDSLNKAAGQQFTATPDEFFLKVRDCVQTSKNQIFTNYQQTSLKFTPFNSKHQKIKDNLRDICDNYSHLSFEQKKKKFIQSLRDNQ